MSDVTHALLAFVASIIGLATLAVVLSKQANTASVIQAGSSGLGTIIGAAVAPVSTFGGLSTSVAPLTDSQINTAFGGL